MSCRKASTRRRPPEDTPQVRILLAFWADGYPAKWEAVWGVVVEGKPARAVARDRKLDHSLVSRWVREFRCKSARALARVAA